MNGPVWDGPASVRRAPLLCLHNRVRLPIKLHVQHARDSSVEHAASDVVTEEKRFGEYELLLVVVINPFSMIEWL